MRYSRSFYIATALSVVAVTAVAASATAVPGCSPAFGRLIANIEDRDPKLMAAFTQSRQRGLTGQKGQKKAKKIAAQTAPAAAPVSPASVPPVTIPEDATPVLKELLVDYRRYAETLWHAADGKPGMGYWGSGRGNGGNEGTRAVASTALVYALLWREGDHSISIADRVEPALRYSAAIHVTGGMKGTDNHTWGNSWQSALWVANLGVAAYLAGDQLKPDTRAAVERVVAYEADRFIGQAPPTMEPGDTKAEENAWDLTAPAAAILLMPHHPHARGWQEAVLRYGFNTLSVEQDKKVGKMADGKPIKEWVSTEQLFPDFTLDNHGFFHPVYAMVAPATMAQAAVYYKLGGRKIPDALQYNVMPEWQMLRYIAQPDGEWIYPQGLDWDLHDYEHVHYWTMLATLYKDPAAALLERRTVAYERRRQLLNGDGSFVGPSGSLGFAREGVQAERIAFALLMHEKFGAPPKATEADWNKLVAHLAPSRIFDRAGFVLHRTERGIFSFSWKNHLMGLVAPQSEDHLDSPYVTTPYPESLVGRFDLLEQTPQQGGKFAVTASTVRATNTGFAAAIDATVNSGKLHQQMAVATAAPGVMVYLDRVTALDDTTVTAEHGLTVGIENDEVSGGQRDITTGGGDKVTAVAGVASDHVLSGNWVNIDNRLSLVTPSGSHLLYRSVGPTNRAGAREDFLYGAFNESPRSFKKGDVVAERAGLLLPNATPEETAQIAAHMTVDHDNGGNTTVHFNGPDGHAYALTLGADGTATWDGQALRPEAQPTIAKQ